MKRIALITAALIASTSALADGYRPQHYRGAPVYHQSYGWVVPTLIGGAIGYALANQPKEQQVIIQERPVYIQPAPVYVQPQPQYEEKTLWDQQCQCWVRAYVPR